MKKRELTNKEFLSLTLPFMISTMTQPLLGAVDTAVMGQLPNAAYIASVSVGAVLFNTLYWMFGFLRVSTSGYAAQALGAGSKEQGLKAFFRPLSLALIVGILCILLQKPIIEFYMQIVKPSQEVILHTSKYFRILIWGAPLVLVNYVTLGWLMGQTKLKASLFMQITSNLLNIGLDFLFVFGFGFDVGGVAVATLISQIYAFAVGIFLMKKYGGFTLRDIPVMSLFDLKSLLDMLKVNVNLMIRTACLLIVNNVFTSTGAGFGTEVLAANAVLQQIIMIMSYAIDGMANGASIFTGKAIGKKSEQLFEDTKIRSVQWMTILVIILSGVYLVGGNYFINLFTNIESVLNIANNYSLYVLFYPVCACAGIVFYGMFTGATHTAPIRDMMLIGMIGFLITRAILLPQMGNHGLWISYLVFRIFQSVIMILFLPKLKSKMKF